MTGCLDDDAIAAYIDGALPAHEVERVDRHIDACAACRGDLSAIVIARGSDTTGITRADDASEVELAPGDTIGRYVVVHEHARGAMGVVAVAADPELGRKVAIKVLRSEVSEQLGASAQHLRDEARAMASLSHPNVVTVHDVGTHAGRIFLAMELVEGVSLRAWLALERRSWRAIASTCIAAGHGLAAAHRTGLVHRDFKPDNVLCGPGDRVRVTDFGLARHDGIAAARSRSTGIVGTPRYMAPEVWRGEPATARSDQWSFCVTLYEALYGVPPFAGTTARELCENVQRATPTFPPTLRLPARVIRTLVRGLRSDPASRFDSLTALLGELEAALRRPLVPWLVAGAAGLAIAGGVAVAALRTPAGPEHCEMPASLLAGTWDRERQAALEDAFAATGRRHAATTVVRVTDILDGYSERWLEARRDACVATRIRGDQSDAMLDARTRCLDRRLSELAALVRVLADKPTPEVVDRATQATRELHPVETCSALGVRTDQPLPAQPDRAAMVLELDRELAAIRAAQLVARTGPAGSRSTAEASTESITTLEARARSVLVQARVLGYAPLTARAAYQVGRLATYASDHAGAERDLHAALDAAAAAHDDRLVASTWIDLVSFAAMQKGDAELALTHARTAEVAFLRADSPSDLRGPFFHARGMAYAMQGKYRDAQASFERALAEASAPHEIAVTSGALCNVELRLGEVAKASTRCWKAVTALEDELGPRHPLVGFALLNAGNVAMQQRDHARARDAFVRALAILAETVGERHVAYALALNNLGMIEQRAEDITGARRDYKRALVLLDELHHADAFLPRLNLGNLERQVGKLAEARTYWEQALAIAESTHGKDSERAAQIWQSLGALEVDLGHLDKAEQAYQRSLAIAEQLFGERHPQVADALDGLGFVYGNRNDCRRAQTYQRRAVAVNEAIYGADHPRVAETLTTLADCQARTGDRAAIANLERALVIHDHHAEAAPFEPAATRWVLAQALVKLGGDKTRAIALAREARALYAKSSDSEAAAVLPAIDRWLAARR